MVSPIATLTLATSEVTSGVSPGHVSRDLRPGPDLDHTSHIIVFSDTQVLFSLYLQNRNEECRCTMLCETNGKLENLAFITHLGRERLSVLWSDVWTIERETPLKYFGRHADLTYT